MDDGQLSARKQKAAHRDAHRAMSLSNAATGCSPARAGGEHAEAIYTVIQTCKANGVDPQAYIADVIAKVASDWLACRWDELMPWNWSPEPARLAA